MHNVSSFFHVCCVASATKQRELNKKLYELLSCFRKGGKDGVTTKHRITFIQHAHALRRGVAEITDASVKAWWMHVLGHDSFIKITDGSAPQLVVMNQLRAVADSVAIMLDLVLSNDGTIRPSGFPLIGERVDLIQRQIKALRLRCDALKESDASQASTKASLRERIEAMENDLTILPSGSANASTPHKPKTIPPGPLFSTKRTKAVPISA